jgi:hypothetical protein
MNCILYTLDGGAYILFCYQPKEIWWFGVYMFTIIIIIVIINETLQISSK